MAYKSACSNLGRGRERNWEQDLLGIAKDTEGHLVHFILHWVKDLSRAYVANRACTGEEGPIKETVELVSRQSSHSLCSHCCVSHSLQALAQGICLEQHFHTNIQKCSVCS